MSACLTSVRSAFNARRKTLRKALAGLVTSEQLNQLGIDDGLRPENLSLADYVAIADQVVEAGGLDQTDEASKGNK